MLTSEDRPQTPIPRSSDADPYRPFGWRVDHDHTTNTPQLIVDDNVAALLMPTELAAKAQHVLSIHMLAGPAIAYRDQCALLADPSGRGELPADLTAWEVVDLAPGNRLTLPDAARGGARWMNRPAPGRPHPPWPAVISAARRSTALDQAA